MLRLKISEKVRVWKNIFFLTLLQFLSACGGGNNASPENIISINGKGQKGSFLADSIITATKLESYASEQNKSVGTVIDDNFGHFTLQLEWQGWTELRISGRYFDEYKAIESPTELTLNNISYIASTTDNVNVNMFTHLAAARISYLLVYSDLNFGKAWEIAQSDLKKVFMLKSLDSNVEKLDITDGIGHLKNDNAILLLFSGSFLGVSGDDTSLLKLADDFSDNGRFDGVATDLFTKIGNFAGHHDVLNKLTANMKRYGFQDPPAFDDLLNIPHWVNQAPTVVVTPASKTFVLGQPIVMDASPSIDPEGSVLTYAWSGPGTQNCGNSELCELQSLTAGTYRIFVTASDDKNNKASDFASISIWSGGDSNHFPEADINPASVTIKSGSSTILDASLSYDLDDDPLTYVWKGPGTENCNQVAKCTIAGLPEGIYYITVSVDDRKGGKDSAVSRLIVSRKNVPPVANAGTDITIAEDKVLELSGTATDSDGFITTYEWKQGVRSIGVGEKITIANLTVGVHNYTLIVTDNDGATGSDTVRVTVTATSNKPPVANAGSDLSIKQGSSALLMGSGADPDGTIVSYQWFKDGLLIADTAHVTVPNLSVGTHEFTLIVTDDRGGAGSDTVKVTILPLDITVNISTSGCAVRIGRNFFVTLTLSGGITGSGTTGLQEYELPGCGGDKIGGIITLATRYSISNIRTINSVTIADMTVTNLAGSETRQVTIVNGNVVVP